MYKLRLQHKFSSAHNLRDYVGACANIHGHTWKVIIEVETSILVKDMIVDFKNIKKAIDARYDHKLINDMVAFNPTAENISGDIYNLVEGLLDEKQKAEKYSISIDVFESENASITYTK